MTILVAKEVFCDRCSEWVRMNTSRVEDDWPKLAIEGWTRSRGSHWCPECSRDRLVGTGTKGVV